MSTSTEHTDASLPTAPTRQWLRDRLTKAGLRATRQRLLILERVVVAKGHPTAEQVHRQVLTYDATVSLGTVYKALDSFVTLGLCKRVLTAEGACRRYDADCTTHHHLYCSNTQEIIDYCDPQLDALIQDFLEARGFQDFRPRSFSLHITGERADPTNEQH